MLNKTKNTKYYKKIEPFLDTRVVGLIVFGLIMVLVSWSGLKVLQTNYELEKNISQLNQRNQVQKLENDNLRLKNTYLESDQYLELTARRQFNKAAKGEKLYLVPESVAMSKTVQTKVEKPTTDQNEQAPKPERNIDKWYQFLFNKD